VDIDLQFDPHFSHPMIHILHFTSGCIDPSFLHLWMVNNLYFSIVQFNDIK